MHSSAPVALVTGASRGIGKATAIALAQAGFDLVITARTVREGERREHSPTLRTSDDSPLPGSLESTEALLRAEGAEVVSVAADILNEPSLVHLAEQAQGRFGQVDVLVNNARYIGPGLMDTVLQTPLEVLDRHIRGNVYAPVRLAQLLLPGMIEGGGGTIVNLTSAAAYSDPAEPIGEGGFGMCYGISKGAIHRFAGFIVNEYADRGITCFNVQPGTVATERIAQDMGEFGFNVGEPPAVTGKTIAWLCTSAAASRLNGRTIEAPFLCAELGLLEDWDGPQLIVQGRHDRSAGDLTALEAALRVGGTMPHIYTEGGRGQGGDDG